MVSGRRTYLELAEKIADFDLPYYFYDGHANINWDINKNNQASISFYAGNDVLDLTSDGTSVSLDWGNKTFSTQWTHLFNSKFFSHFTFAGSRFDSDTKVKFGEALEQSLTRIHEKDAYFFAGVREGAPLFYRALYLLVGKQDDRHFVYEMRGTMQYPHGDTWHDRAGWYRGKPYMVIVDLSQLDAGMDVEIDELRVFRVSLDLDAAAQNNEDGE